MSFELIELPVQRETSEIRMNVSVRLEQSEKEELPMLVKVSGIEIDISPEQLENA